jgi:hypothetical protein
MGFDKAAAERALGLFNDKAERLRQGKFARRVFGGESGVTVSGGVDKPTTAVRHGPDEDAIEAAVLTFRFFIQDNEPSSLRNMSKLYPTLPTAAYLSANFLDAREKLNKYLDGPLGMQITINGKALTRREVYDTFIYGDLAHSNQAKEEQFKRWQKNEILFALLQNEFVVTLAQTLDFLWYMQMLNKEALAELGKLP